jgi:hypothetical protein
MSLPEGIGSEKGRTNVKLKGKRLMAAAGVTAVLALGSAAAAQTVLAAPHPTPKTHVKYSLTDKGFRACAEKHDVLGAYLEFGGSEAFAHLVEELLQGGAPLAGQAFFAREAAKFGTAFFTFWFDCVVPYVHPRPETLPGGFIILPGFTVGPPSPPSQSPSQQPSSPPLPPTQFPGDDGVPFYTLGGGDG